MNKHEKTLQQVREVLNQAGIEGKIRITEKTVGCSKKLEISVNEAYFLNKYEKSLQQVRKALDRSGVKGDILVTEIAGHSEQLEVYVNGTYFGVFDTDKNTFKNTVIN